MDRDLIAKARIVVGLWDYHLFGVGTKEARLKKADIMHSAIQNLQVAITASQASDQTASGGAVDRGATD